MKPDQTAIAIMGEQVPARHELIAIQELNFLPDNPRVYAAIRGMADFDDLTSEEKQVRIYERLLREPSVRNLKPQIERDGGLQDPIIVRMHGRQVIEGNSRLAVYRKLWDETNDDQWARIRCLVVTELTDDQQTRLLAQAHLIGKTDWSPYAKALLCFRWVEEEGNTAAKLAQLSGIPTRTINKGVKIIQLMKDNDDDKLSHFSYYDVLVTNRKISATIAKRPALKDTLFKQIKAEAFTAQEMRDRVPTVIQKPKILRKFENGVTLEDAYDRAKISGTQRRLKRICDGLDDVEKSDIEGLEHNEVGAVRQILRKIRRNLKRVSDMIEEKAGATTK